MSTRADATRQWMALMRSWGFTVLEAAGWETRDAEPGTAYDPSRMFLEHHDASTVLSGNWGSLAYVTANKLAQLVYSRDGQAMVVAAGVCWHAGVGGPFADIPANQGNRYSMAVEVANSGTEPYSPALTRLIIAGEAAWCIVHRRGADRVRGHKEWATPPGRKTDPSIDMNQRRADVAAALANGPTQEDNDMNANQERVLQEIANRTVALVDVAGRPIEAEIRMTAKLDALIALQQQELAAGNKVDVDAIVTRVTAGVTESVKASLLDEVTAAVRAELGADNAAQADAIVQRVANRLAA